MKSKRVVLKSTAFLSLRRAEQMSSRRTDSIRVLHVLLVLACLGTLVATAFVSFAAPPQATERKIVSDDFTKKRQQSASQTSSKGSNGQSSSGALSKSKQPSRIYRLASAQVIKRTKPATNPAPVDQLGITIWRLRSVGANDTGTRMLVREKGKLSGWVPERVEADTTFREGDYLRLSVESLRVGYLYIVDRDLLADGSSGPAMLIYPWVDTDRVDNQVRPGKLVDIPGQEDDPSYFTARLTSPNQVGEILTIIVTSSPLDLPISNDPIQISKVDLAQWEKMWAGQSERFEMEGGAGEAWTKQEQQASAKVGPRQLTRDDPAPQTIYRISANDTKAILVNVRLRYSK